MVGACVLPLLHNRGPVPLLLALLTHTRSCPRGNMIAVGHHQAGSELQVLKVDADAAEIVRRGCQKTFSVSQQH